LAKGCVFRVLYESTVHAHSDIQRFLQRTKLKTCFKIILVFYKRNRKLGSCALSSYRSTWELKEDSRSARSTRLALLSPSSNSHVLLELDRVRCLIFYFFIIMYIHTCTMIYEQNITRNEMECAIINYY